MVLQLKTYNTKHPFPTAVQPWTGREEGQKWKNMMKGGMNHVTCTSRILEIAGDETS